MPGSVDASSRLSCVGAGVSIGDVWSKGVPGLHAAGRSRKRWEGARTGTALQQVCCIAFCVSKENRNAVFPFLTHLARTRSRTRKVALHPAMRDHCVHVMTTVWTRCASRIAGDMPQRVGQMARALALRRVFRPRSRVHESASNRGRWQGATTKSYPGDASRRSNAASGHEGRRGMYTTSGMGH